MKRPWDKTEDPLWFDSFKAWQEWASKEDKQIRLFLERLSSIDLVLVYELCECAIDAMKGPCTCKT